MNLEKIEKIISERMEEVMDFPKPGILFRNLNPAFSDVDAFDAMIDTFEQKYYKTKITKIAGVEARGFILAGALASLMGVAPILIRKSGKLPPGDHIIKENYTKEYGDDCIEMDARTVTDGENVLIIDDLLATGNTVIAANNLLIKAGANVVEAAFVAELTELGASKILKDRYNLDTFSLWKSSIK